MDRQIRILLADGNEEFCGRLKQTLEEDGRFAVVGVAGDGVRACELMQSCHPDVLALDLMLPKMDGIAVLKKAQELESAPRALVMTGFMTEYVGAMAAELGAEVTVSYSGPWQTGSARWCLLEKRHPRGAMTPTSRRLSLRSSMRSACLRTSRAISICARRS